MSRETVIQAKEDAVNQLTEKMNQASAIVIAEYRGLTVEKTETLRRQLRKEGCEMFVMKNNISRRAAKNAGYEALDPELIGPNGIILAFKESVAAPRILYEFARKNSKLVVKSGIIDGDFYDQGEVKQIAALPPRNTLLAMLATQLYAPLRDLAVGLDLITNKE
ncbi:MAG: 50S ribosomal protein L10 [Candidatus Izemoplasmatales bacterium]|nr:50S ribosomal protein L10 [Candidatus Izemoplasmatales bacterium]NLF48257.1 50S ribosomal protein L10 [Acholeplasmataceae bacterium]MDD4355233.1 50S ribosomal protein L10 [Candidatus Izemoplasmatales bacterium]MDD4988225.1 50S ribosomal protein L10 [Candidatus Izemoplasmatales bacterium]MDD5601960.1 50S ribosomal protein L10 [Candidatus Izemoplasmatales bacterium]